MNKAQLELTRLARKPRGVRAPINSTNRVTPDDTQFQDTIAELNAELGYLEKLAAQVSQLKAQYANACAAIAQTDNEYFRVMCKVMDPLSECFPHHPLMRKWNAVRRLWQLELLKQN
jgi:hypothetical protein